MLREFTIVGLDRKEGYELLKSLLAKQGYRIVGSRLLAPDNPSSMPIIEACRAYITSGFDTDKWLQQLNKAELQTIGELQSLSAYQAWQLLGRHMIKAICLAMGQLKVTFADIDPRELKLHTADAWQERYNRLTKRAANVLARGGVTGEPILKSLTDKEISDFRNAGVKIQAEIRALRDWLNST